MDWHKNRLPIAGLLLIAVGGLAIWAWGVRTGDTPVRETQQARGFPDLSRDQISVIEITRPEAEGQTIRLERREEQWFVTQPIEVIADQSAVSTALDKLDEMEVAGVAASNPEFHERLEVDPAHGVRVVARGADGNALADLWIGAYRSGNTMVRLEGEERVVSVRGSIKFAFNKELRDWRDRAILNVEADDVTEVAWRGPNGTFRFDRAPAAAPAAPEGEGEAPAQPTLGEWRQAEISYVPPAPAAPETPPAGRRPPPEPAAPAPLTAIEGFQASKVRSMVASLARMRAADFAGPDVTPESAGLGPDAARVTLTTRGEGDEGPQTFTVILGNEANAERHDFYAQREGEPTIYVISRFLGERVSPTATSFTESAPATPPGEGEGAPGEGMPMPMPGGEGGGAQLPPEVMEQIRRQLEQQGLGGGAGP
ncbi:DUF4340 domain-containing protein [Sandaracinus amylolyticus]|uniref:DUF4340 domain-containing protein n=1 Tax=Sandaracinus amylolyticus TaxID=927083 RepID=A0A0F6W571_9BACT|nr:DUF4340 domain-containing protein [Sandaracinus amylolyticus]AKF07717.1 hypothetical protein DB32_004866 [Sandaracinus amylolyticus]